MAHIHDDVLDNGVKYVDDNVENVYLLSADPALDFSKITTYKLGTKASPTCGAPEDGASTGRRVVFSAITDGVVNAAGKATHFAVTDDSASKILCSGPLGADLDVATGSPWTLTAFSVTIPDA